MRRLILFAKQPRAGHVKTRLTPPLTAEEALDLYRAFLEDQIRLVAGFAPEAAVELCLDRPEPDAFEATQLPPGVAASEQGGGSIGDRMRRALRRSLDRDGAATVIIGADAPTLPASRVRDAFRALERGAAAVIAPAEDGGYVLVGLSEPRDELFDRIPWGGARVMAVTLERAAASDVALELLPGWFDVDRYEDLQRLHRDMSAAATRRRAPSTARALERLARARGGVV
jgi:rSAM/selenodomain-associated transferase 1